MRKSGECHVVSTGSYAENGPDKEYDKTPFLAAIDALETVDDVTLLVMPEAVLLDGGPARAAARRCHGGAVRLGRP